MIVRTGFRIIRSICLCFHEAIAPASCFEVSFDQGTPFHGPPVPGREVIEYDWLKP